MTAAMAVQLRSVAKHEEDERAEIKRLVLKANKDLDLAGSAGELLGFFPHIFSVTCLCMCQTRRARGWGRHWRELLVFAFAALR